MAIKLGINGFGRIGRLVFRAALLHPNVEVLAINDLADAQTNAHLLKYDSLHGTLKGRVEPGDGKIFVDNLEVKVLKEKDLQNLPWQDVGVDIVIECTGLYTDALVAATHLNNGAKKVLISAPAKHEDLTVVMGVNEQDYEPSRHRVISNASCTTNCLAPVAKVLHEKFGIRYGLMTTVHSVTNDQRLLDQAHKDLRRARAAGSSIIPTTTGAARAVGKVLPALKDKLNGFAMRVPTQDVSIVDLVAEVERKVTVEEVNDAFREAADTDLKNILGYSEEPLVSIDYRGDPRSSIVDTLSTMVMEGTMVKVLSWYDNEWGYSNRIIDFVEYIAAQGL